MKIKKYPCRCGGKTRLEYRDEHTGGILIKNVPVLVCEKCGEEYYLPGIPRMIEGIREAIKSIGRINVRAEEKVAIQRV
ncbi:MAG: YgiT-type zinc finger protein [Candidatus Hydrothermarchaeota archaeon]|nr:YgiT-type zinc finger protein [Candidatus Hydrothermarchaeota archaeon]